MLYLVVLLWILCGFAASVLVYAGRHKMPNFWEHVLIYIFGPLILSCMFLYAVAIIIVGVLRD